MRIQGKLLGKTITYNEQHCLADSATLRPRGTHTCKRFVRSPQSAGRSLVKGGNCACDTLYEIKVAADVSDRTGGRGRGSDVKHWRSA